MMQQSDGVRNGHGVCRDSGVTKLDGHLSFKEKKHKNPFVQHLHLTTLDKIQVILMSLIVPIRLVLVAVTLTLGFFFAWLGLLGYNRSKQQIEPLSRWRNLFRPLSVFFCRMMFFCGGFHWVTERGERVGSDVAPILVTGPHTTFFDALVVVYLGLTTIVAKSGTENIPFFGTITQYTQPILVHREDRNSRASTVHEIQRRAAMEGKWPQVMIFPEGTCTNQSCLINFKPGAFIPAVPVQPVCLRYTNRMNTTSWTWKGPSAFEILWLTLANFTTKLEIEFLPVYTPSEAEKSDPMLFSQNVRALMAKALDLPMIDYSYEDGLALMHNIDLPVSEHLTHINSLVRAINITVDDLRSRLLQKLQEKIPSNEINANTEVRSSLEHVTYETFAARMNISPESTDLRRLYNYYLKGDKADIDMRAFTVHMAMLSRSCDVPQLFKFAFEVYDQENRGFLYKSEINSLLQAFGLSERNFTIKDESTYDDFLMSVKSHAECAKWFKCRKSKASLNHKKDLLPSGNAERHEKVQ